MRRGVWVSAAWMALGCSFPDITIVQNTSASATSAGGAGGSSTGGSGGDPCAVADGDGDGEPSELCGGHDCNDDDARANPGQRSYFNTAMEGQAPPGGPFDFDCSGMAEKDPANRFTGCVLAGCTGEGFDWDQASCGTTNGWVKCMLLMGMLCEPENQVTSERLRCH